MAPMMTKKALLRTVSVASMVALGEGFIPPSSMVSTVPPSLLLRQAALPKMTLSSTALDDSLFVEKQQDSMQKENAEKENTEERIDWTKYWYPVMPLQNLDDDQDMETKATPITILDKKLVIWRSSSGGDSSNHQYSVLADTCPHRRAPLSNGKIIRQHADDDSDSTTTTATLACRYHGWQFDKDGACKSIPMMQKQPAQTLSKAFCVQSYPTQQQDGLLWVYMDPTETNPPPKPAAALQPKNSKQAPQSFSLTVFPVSFQSMIENSFDPSHAPFTHERLDPNKKSFMSYSSQNAIPMERYELTPNTTVSRDGFTLQHSPYHMSTSSATATVTATATSTTTRQFIAPYTNVAKLPWFNTTLHFVPSRPGETLVFSGGMMAGGSSIFPKYISRFIPKRIKTMVQEFMHFYFANFAEGVYRFYNQDVQIMQGQDERKQQQPQLSRKASWKDMYPTTSDAGVQIFQTWMERFGGRPAYTMPSLATRRRSSPYLLSAWDRHAKYCPQCKRTIRRLSNLSKVSRKVSRWTLSTSMVGSMVQLLLLSFAKSGRSNAVGIRSIPFTVFLFMVSVAFKLVSFKCNKLLETVFVSPHQVPEYQLMDIYAR